MERYREKQEEFEKKYRGKISNLFTGIDGAVSVNIIVQDKNQEIGTMNLQISPELQKKLNVKGRLSDGMEVIITTDLDGYVLKIERILH